MAAWQRALLQAPDSRRGDGGGCEFVILLGHAVDHATWAVSNITVDRLRAAEAVVCGPGAPSPHATVVLSGGTEQGPPTEADVMAHWLRARGVCGEAALARLVLERGSTSTRENALGSLRAIAGAGGGGSRGSPARVCVVTSEYHSARALRVFDVAARELAAGASFDFMFAVPPQGVQRSADGGEEPDAARMRDFWRECLAFALYWARGWV